MGKNLLYKSTNKITENSPTLADPVEVPIICYLS